MDSRDLMDRLTRDPVERPLRCGEDVVTTDTSPLDQQLPAGQALVAHGRSAVPVEAQLPDVPVALRPFEPQSWIDQATFQALIQQSRCSAEALLLAWREPPIVPAKAGPPLLRTHRVTSSASPRSSSSKNSSRV